jgi:hypothetical protein
MSDTYAWDSQAPDFYVYLFKEAIIFVAEEALGRLLSSTSNTSSTFSENIWSCESKVKSMYDILNNHLLPGDGSTNIEDVVLGYAARLLIMR